MKLIKKKKEKENKIFQITKWEFAWNSGKSRRRRTKLGIQIQIQKKNRTRNLGSSRSIKEKIRTNKRKKY